MREEDAQERNERLFTGKGYGLVRHPLDLRSLPPPRLPSGPDAKQRRHGGGRHRLFLYRDFFRGAASRAAVRRGVPGVPTTCTAVLPAPARRPAMNVGSDRRQHGKGAAPVKEVLAFLARAYPGARVLLDYRNPFELLVATVLAAQCTDERVNAVTPPLFRAWPGPSPSRTRARRKSRRRSAPPDSTGTKRGRSGSCPPSCWNDMTDAFRERWRS